MKEGSSKDPDGEMGEDILVLEPLLKEHIQLRNHLSFQPHSWRGLKRASHLRGLTVSMTPRRGGVLSIAGDLGEAASAPRMAPEAIRVP